MAHRREELRLGAGSLVSLVARCAQHRLVLFAEGNVGVGANEAATRQRHAADFQHGAVRPGALIGLRPVGQAAGQHEAAQPSLNGVAVPAELLLLPLPAQDVVEMRLARHQRCRQAKLLDRPEVADLHPVAGIDHEDALAHVLERRFEQL